MTINL